VLTRAAVLPMTIAAGLLAVRQPGFETGWFLLALLGIVLAHVANNLMNDLFDTEVGQDTRTPRPIRGRSTPRTRACPA
jgi:1,4-dihydroxy-2-naphthoate octaprenyltransferase